mmetsp:Transcript_2791/g.6110  ORF Transcript_2791/g.6110 Transcript_2791/m.6110 type:complete len:845 (+) Transcript_2791:164-2698(+)
MDFSSPARALLSLQRRRPPLPDDVLSASKTLMMKNGGDGVRHEQDYMAAVETLIRSFSSSSDGGGAGVGGENKEEEQKDGGGDHKQQRWEGLAVGLLLATDILVKAADDNRIAKRVYVDGPRVPEEKKTPDVDGPGGEVVPSPTTGGGHSCPAITASYTKDQISHLATLLHQAAVEHLEHSEPRIRTFVAKAVGAHATWSFGLAVEDKDADGNGDAGRLELHTVERNEIYHTLLRSIDEHIRQGRDNPDQYSKSSTGALDDTTGWRALETNWQCLACWIASLGSRYYEVVGQDENELDLDAILKHLEYSAVTHVNRHVRAAAIAVLEQLTVSAGDDSKYWSYLEDGTLRQTIVKVLKASLGDNWSQVRMAGSVLNRVFWTTLRETCRFPEENLQLLYPVLVPRMCLNRFYLAQGVKLYSHQTWKLVFPENGVQVVAETIAPIVRYYVQMCDADNHVVREAACQAVAELAVKIGMDDQYASALQPHVPVLLQALLMCFHDESWPVRDEACLACGTFCRSYPEECRSELETLWTRWTEQLTDQIWSVRADAAVALGQACQAYGQEFLDRLLKFIDVNLPAAKSQPKMTMDEYKALQNNMDAHTDSQLYSCGSLAPKLKKKAGAGRIGCSNCDVNRPKQPWEATDGCLYLIRELIETCEQPDSTLPPLSDELLLPLMREIADVCRVSHFPQGDEMRATLWRQLPGMMAAVGKQRCKKLYLEIFMDLILRNLESSTASAISKHAATTCASELGKLIGPSIFRGRVYDDRQREVLDMALREHEMEERNMAPLLKHNDQKQFSPFEPPGLLDTPYSPKFQPGLPPELLNSQNQASTGTSAHPGVDDTMSM